MNEGVYTTTKEGGQSRHTVGYDRGNTVLEGMESETVFRDSSETTGDAREDELMWKIKKVVITEFGDESKLAMVEGDLPDPGAGEVQLAVEYSIVSGSDVNMRRGTYPFQKKAPLTPGYSVFGKVRLNGKGCSKFKVGDRVACLSKYEGQAELVNLPERFLVRVPEGVDPKAAVALVLDWVTAYELLHSAAHVRSGQKIFVHGLSGSVGGALLSLTAIQGAQTFGTAAVGKHEQLRKLGAVPFDYSNKKWISAIQGLGGGDAVFDPLRVKRDPLDDGLVARAYEGFQRP